VVERAEQAEERRGCADRQRRALLATLLTSRGAAMLLAGDELVLQLHHQDVEHHHGRCGQVERPAADVVADPPRRPHDHRRPRRFAGSAMGLLKARAWAGNVRELKNLVERVLIMADSDPIEAKDLPPEARVSPTEISERGLTLATLSEFKEYAEREFLVTKLRENGWNISRTAEMIRTPRSNLYKKIDHHKISREGDA